MKISVHFYVLGTALLLLTVAGLVFYDASFPVVFIAVLSGQAWWILTVYKVLTDHYSTSKTFDDWYEDQSLRKD